MSIDIIKIKNTDKKENLSKLKPELLEVGELALVRESNYERLYTKNTDGEVTPLNRVMDAGEIPLPTIQEAWINTGLAKWVVFNISLRNRIMFKTKLTGNLTLPSVSDMDKLTLMDGMFSGFTGLITLNLSNFNTSNVTDMNNMFWSCNGLTSLNISSFDTSNVTNMSYMFGHCSSLTSLDVSNFNTSKVTSMNEMFGHCSSLTSLDLSNWDTSNVTDMQYMFNGCKNLNKITCKQSFQDWCWKNQDKINLPTAMREGGDGTWIIVD